MKYNRIKTAARRVCAMLMCVLFVAVGALTVSAADTSVTFTANDKFSFTPKSTDLFDGFKEVIPGDSLTQTITVKNESSRTVEIYLKADGVEEQYKPFLSYVSMTVTAEDAFDSLFGLGGREIYKSPASKFGSDLNTLKYRVSLGTFSTGATVKLTVTADVSIEMSDEYQKALGEIVWVFTAEDMETEETTTTEETTEEPEETTAPDTTTPDTTIPYYPPYYPPQEPPYTPPNNPVTPNNPTPNVPERVEVEPEPEPEIEPDPEPEQEELIDIDINDVPLAPESADSTAADLGIDIPDILVPLGGLIPQTGDDWAALIACVTAIAATVMIVLLVAARRRLEEDKKTDKTK